MVRAGAKRQYGLLFIFVVGVRAKPLAKHKKSVINALNSNKKYQVFGKIPP